jgi:serine/threonine protein phosphatase PrpC
VPTVPVLPDRLTLGQHGVVADSGILAGGLVSLRAASVQGLSHRSGATTRQDSYSFAADEHRIVVAVADGLGSAPMSHLGAEAVARAAAAVALTGGIRDVAAAAFAALDALQDRHHRPAQDFATTLAVVVVDIGTAEGPWKVSAAEWGDSRASVHIPGSVVDGHPDWRRIAAATAGELYGNTVRPLPVFKEPTARGTADWSAGEMLLVASDGIDGQLAASNPVGHGLASAWESTPSLWQFIADVAFDRAGARDDRTAVCLFRPGPTTTETDADGRAHTEGQAQPPESAPQTVVSDSGHSGKG